MTAFSLVFLLMLGGLSLFLVALGLPGIWMLFVGILAAVWIHPSASVSPAMIAALFGMCMLAELMELLCSYFGAKRYGVTTAGTWAGIGGGIAGAVILGSVFPLAGAVPGAFAGTFLGAFAVELARGGGRAAALRQGYGAFVARVLAVAVKLSVAVVMLGLGFYWLKA